MDATGPSSAPGMPLPLSRYTITNAFANLSVPGSAMSASPSTSWNTVPEMLPVGETVIETASLSVCAPPVPLAPRSLVTTVIAAEPE